MSLGLRSRLRERERACVPIHVFLFFRHRFVLHFPTISRQLEAAVHGTLQQKRRIRKFSAPTGRQRCYDKLISKRQNNDTGGIFHALVRNRAVATPTSLHISSPAAFRMRNIQNRHSLQTVVAQADSELSWCLPTKRRQHMERIFCGFPGASISCFAMPALEFPGETRSI